MAKSAMDEETGFSNAGEFTVRMEERFEKISEYYDELEKKATLAMERVHITFCSTAIIGSLAVVVAILLEKETLLLALVLGLSLSYVAFSIFSALSGLYRLHGPIRDGVIMEQEFLSDLKVFRDSEGARLDLDKMETVGLEMLEFIPDFAALNSGGYLMILSSVMLAVAMFMVAAIPVFFY